MQTLAFASRNAKEILRDRINLFFGILFPLVLLLLLTLIQSNIPVEQFPISKLAPGIAIFGLSFISLFSGVLISKDRESSFMMRLMSSPMKPKDFIIGYMLPLLPMAIVQSTACFIVALFLGLSWSPYVILAIIATIPSAFIFIGIGLICGTFLTDKQVGGLCGALLTNLSAWFSGTWFDVSLVGGVFEKIANGLPFIHAVNLGKAIIQEDMVTVFPELVWILGYAIAILVLAILLFTKRVNTMY